jgi:ketosteroid isomerase-like protein
MRLALAPLLLSALISQALAAEVPKGGDVAAVKAAVEKMVFAFDKKDLPAIVAVSAADADSVYFGTDEAEIWVGFESLKAATEKQFKALDSGTSTLRDLRVKLLAGGKVAVATYLLDVQGKSGGEPFALKGVRITAVLEKRGGKWLVVSSHGSMPVRGQAVKY